MTDSEFTMLVLLGISSAIILFQWWRISRYRRKIEKIAMARMVAAPPSLPVAAVPSERDDEELVRIKQRLQVLERIATDGNHRLDDEFEALRRA